MKIKNTVTTLLKVIGLIALLFAINAYRKALLLFNPKVLISVYFCFGLLCGFVFRADLLIPAFADRTAVQRFPFHPDQRCFNDRRGLGVRRNSLFRGMTLSFENGICYNPDKLIC